jgi:hypothetical protein
VSIGLMYVNNEDKKKMLTNKIKKIQKKNVLLSIFLSTRSQVTNEYVLTSVGGALLELLKLIFFFFWFFKIWN